MKKLVKASRVFISDRDPTDLIVILAIRHSLLSLIRFHGDTKRAREWGVLASEWTSWKNTWELNY